MKFTLVTKEYETTFLQGWDARVDDIFVNPYLNDFETLKYQAWHDGWQEADLALKNDNYGYPVRKTKRV